MPRSIVFLFVVMTALFASLPAANANPQRIVSVSLMTDEFLLDLVPPERLKALSRSADDASISNVVAASRSVPVRAWLDLETILRLGPDLVVAADWNSRSELDFLVRKGIEVFVVATPRRWSDVKDRIALLGRRLGVEERAKELLARLERDERALEIARTRVPSGTSILDWSPFGTSMAKGTLWNDVVRMAGFENAANALGVDAYGFASVSKEVLLRLDPDFLVVTHGVAQGTFENDTVYRHLKAVKSGRVLTLSQALTSTTSHYALRTARELIDAAYPSR